MKEVLENIFYFVDFGQEEIDCNKFSEYPIVINLKLWLYNKE